MSCGYIVPTVLEMLRSLKPHRVLDLGAGNGAMCRQLVAAGYSVAGVEPDAQGIAIARSRCPDAPFYQLAVGDAPDALLTDHPGGFDVVVSTEVIEHLYSPKQLVAFARAALRENGHLLITTPHHGYFKNLAISVFNGWDRHADPLRDGGHIKLFSRRTMSALLHEGGFKVCRWGGVGRVPGLWKSMVVLAVKQ
jgi:2-polyprenyl-3-methyl-5-hydroxy-6-metoxy-1,4-benzoquinol methylase